MTGAGGLCGGIASANLNVLYALVELAETTQRGLTVFSLLEREGDRPGFLPNWVRFRAFEGKRFRYLANILAAAVCKPIFLFDHVRLAFPLLPLTAAGVVKTVIFAHGSESWKHVRSSSRWSFQFASLCLTNSYFTLRKMRERISRLRAEACPLGLSPEFPLNGEVLETRHGVRSLEAVDGENRTLKDRVLLLVGRMDSREREKGHRELINLLPELLKEHCDVQLVFAGPGDDRKDLQELAWRKGAASSVFLPGFVSNETLQFLYHHCYAFVMPSKQEGFGLAYLEAMNYGKPCVGCFDQGAEDIVIDGETGFLVRDPTNPRELLEALGALLRDPEQARRLGRSGFERLHQYFTSQHYQERLKKQLARLL